MRSSVSEDVGRIGCTDLYTTDQHAEVERLLGIRSMTFEHNGPLTMSQVHGTFDLAVVVSA
jgi:hypothetical protein